MSLYPDGRRVLTSYSTVFAVTENPIADGGHWLSGGRDGLDWADIRTAGGVALGTQDGVSDHFNDASAVLRAAYHANQWAQATVFTTNQQTGSVYEEVALRLRSTLSAHFLNGYEAGYRVNHDGTQYCGVTRWNGLLNDFDSWPNGTGPGLFNGDVISASIIGTIATMYINGIQVYQVDVSTAPPTGATYVIANGSPGLAVYLHGATGLNGDYGLTTFTAREL